MTADPNRHHTRAATLAGVFPAPKLPRATPSAPSSPSGAHGSTGSPKSRPVSPALLYSDVVAASLSRGVSPAAPEGQGDVSGTASVGALSELLSLSRDVDYGSVQSQSPIRTVVHGEPMSVHSNVIDSHATPLPPPSAQSDSASTVSQAAEDMSREELVSLARRYESMARDVMAKANQKLSVPLDTEPDSGSEDEPPTHELSPLSTAIPAGEGPSRNKGKGPDPRNWGAAGFSVDFSDKDLEAQRKAFDNFAEINRKVKQEEPYKFTPNPHVPSVEPTVKIPRATPIVSEPLLENKGMNQPGQANAERIAVLESELSRLRQSAEPVQLVSNKPLSKAKRAVEQNIADLIRDAQHTKKSRSKKPSRATPSRIAAGSFLDKAIRGTARLNHNPPPSEPSDSSSSSRSDSEPSSPSTVVSSMTHGRRTSTSTRQIPLSSRSRKHGMLLKPIPPTKYAGDPDANAFHRFVREGSAYVKMGRVPSRDQVFYLSYFLESKARDFYNQVVVRDEDSYTLEKFFLELFEFCFPVDFRGKQRKRLARCKQDRRSVTAHVAEFSQIYNTIGLVEGQEKVVKLWNSLRADIRQEMYRKDLDPEISSWDEVVRAAERAEIIRNLDSDSESSESDANDSKTQPDKSRIRAGGRIASKHGQATLRTSSVETSTSEPQEKKRSVKRRNEMLAQGLCFTCEQPGHLARNCPTTVNVKSNVKGKPPGFGLHSVHLNTTDVGLLDTTEVLDTLPDTLPIGALIFGYEPALELSRNAAIEDESESVRKSTVEAAEDGVEVSTISASDAEDDPSPQEAGLNSHATIWRAYYIYLAVSSYASSVNPPLTPVPSRPNRVPDLDVPRIRHTLAPSSHGRQSAWFPRFLVRSKPVSGPASRLISNTARINKQWNGRLDPNLPSSALAQSALPDMVRGQCFALRRAVGSKPSSTPRLRMLYLRFQWNTLRARVNLNLFLLCLDETHID
ncbi:hypothetical protein C8R47DRAFT_1203327 [Mycena vitilis]|nr:hypothetical protein C8R47DRAFT_1203327 [Mycena vitilis]